MIKSVEVSMKYEENHENEETVVGWHDQLYDEILDTDFQGEII